MNRLPLFHLILSAIGKPTYKLAKFLLPFLTPLTENEYSITDAFHFAKKICKQDTNLYMASLDVDYLCANIPPDETIDICMDSFYKDDENSPKNPKYVFLYLFTITTKAYFFMFSNIFYKQTDGVPMGSPLGPALANIFMCSFENKWLKDCPHSLIPVFYRWYVEDVFLLFSCLNQAEKFKTYLSSKHSNINFSLEKENDGRLSFLYISIF